MNEFSDLIASIWGEKPKSNKMYCHDAGHFDDFAEVLRHAAYEDTALPGTAGLVSVNQKKLQLLDKYFEYRNFVSKSHRDYRGNHHICLWHVFEEYYNKLKVIELSITPPMLYIPLPPPPPLPPPQIGGIIFGESE